MPENLNESVSLLPASIERRPTVDTLLQLYLHDFSEYAPLESGHGEVGENGRFAWPMLDSYWIEQGRAPLLIMRNDRIAGFVLVNNISVLNRPIDHQVAEFFVLRKYRRAGIGTRAATLLFDRMRGRWEVPVAFYNQRAIPFWRAVARDQRFPVEECACADELWRGYVLCFDSGLP